MLVNEGKEAFSNFCFHVLAVWRIIPDDVVLSGPTPCLTGCSLIQKVVTVTTFGNCNEESIIYQAEVTSQTTTETYIGLCDTSFKLRYRNHTSSFRNERYRNATELSKHVWNLKDQNIQYNIKWRKIKQARSYSNVTKKCNLCLWEKYFILCKPEMSSLNNRNELTSSCRHSRKFLLKNVIT